MPQWPNFSGCCLLVLLSLTGPYTGQYANVIMAERFRLLSSCLVKIDRALGQYANITMAELFRLLFSCLFIIGRALYRAVRQCHNGRTFQALVFWSCYNWQGPIQGSMPIPQWPNVSGSCLLVLL